MSPLVPLEPTPSNTPDLNDSNKALAHACTCDSCPAVVDFHQEAEVTGRIASTEVEQDTKQQQQQQGKDASDSSEQRVAGGNNEGADDEGRDEAETIIYEDIGEDDDTAGQVRMQSCLVIMLLQRPGPVMRPTDSYLARAQCI
jgi:hypothetical protein